MTEIYVNGFERGDFSQWTMTSGSPSVVTTDPCHGTYHASMPPSAYCIKSFSGETIVYARARVQFKTTLPTTNNEYWGVMLFWASGLQQLWVWVSKVSDQVRWTLGYMDGDAQQVLYGSTPSLDTWYTVEAYLKVDGVAGQAILYINGVADITSPSNEDTDNRGSVTDIQLVNGGTGNTHYFDCVVVDTAAIGTDSRHVEGLWVNNLGSERSQWTEVGDSPFLDAQDQPSHYIYCENSKKAEHGDFEFANSSQTSETLVTVTLHLYGQCPGTGMDVWVSGDNGSSWTEYVNPAIPSSWGWFTVDVSAQIDTWGEVNAGEMYLKAANSNDRHDMDAAFFEVVFTLAGVQTYTKEFTFDGLLQKTGTKDLTFDGWLQKTYTKDLTFDAYLKIVGTKECTFDGWLQGTLTKELTFDGWLQQSFTKDYTFDAYLTGTGTKDLTLDGWVQGTLTKELTFDGWLLAHQAKELTFDAYLKYVQTKDYSFDAFLLVHGTKEYTFDAYLQAAAGVKSFTFDGWLLQTLTKEFTLDALLLAAQTKGWNFDAFLQKIKGFTYDAWLEAAPAAAAAPSPTYGAPAPRPDFPVYLLKLIHDYLEAKAA